MPAPANYSLVFSDEFDRLSIANTTTATANWYTAQPWGGGFGDAQFMPVGGAASPFSIVQQAGASALQIEMTRNAAGQLQSGLISNTFPNGTSTTPHDGDPYGYYEARMWLPAGKGVWPAFWSIEQERLSTTRDHVFEVDVMEQHGSALADRYASTLHDWNWKGTTLEGHTSQAHQNIVGQGVLTTGWHTYGVEIKSDTMTFFFDGHAHFSLPTPATLNTDPMFMIDLAAGGGWPVDPALDDAKLYVDYFRAYELNGSTPPTSPPTGNVLVGTSGDDTFTINNASTGIKEQPGGGFDTVNASVSYTLPDNVEKLRLSGSAALDGTGNAAGNQLYGNTNANTLSGLGGDDYLYGDAGNDKLVGGDGNDKLYGGNGNDLLVGGLGIDRLDGEAGADTFRFESVADSPYSARDTIISFSGTAGDRVDISAIDANTLVSGNQAFTFIGSDSFTAAGQVRVSNGILSADVNGDHVPDFGVVVGTAHLDSGYFIL
ncbi:family 16 glycosylhydrolase [Rhizobium sp. RAF56]|uniref:family 16 glycosylhydrolase n=1 Tax=Rhizobium sp. RAF56 TaxID=3233062 RepID=UPI003F9646BB